MKIKHIVLASTILVSVSAFAQKDELKALKKIYGKEEIKGNDLTEYKSLVAKVGPLATEEADKVYAAFYKTMLPILEVNAIDPTQTAQMQATLARVLSPKAVSDLAAGLNATLDYEKKAGKKIYTDDINETITSFKPQFIDYALALGRADKNKEAAEVLYAIYQMDVKDQDMLFYAASSAVNAQEYDKALEYYSELKRLNYTGEGKVYFATNKADNKEENFGANKSLRDISVSTGSHSKPREEKIPSKRPEIYKNIALIYLQQGKNKEAISAIQEAKTVSPGDKTLASTEMEIYLKMNDYDTYSKLVNEALANDPNNVQMNFNLGVISNKANKVEDAEKYFKKVIEIDPNYIDAYLSLSAVLLKPDDKIVEEMNKLGTSDKDNKRYEVLKSQRQKLFNSVMPYLEKAHQLDPKNEDVKNNLKSVYNFLELTEKVKALKAE
jgi:tetratricopeptide (TPR) repeat protein